MPGTVLSAKHGTRMAHSSSQNSQPMERDPVSVMTQRDVMGREVGGGFMFGNACKN